MSYVQKPCLEKDEAALGTSCVALQLLGPFYFSRAEHTWHPALTWPQAAFPYGFPMDSPEDASCIVCICPVTETVVDG